MSFHMNNNILDIQTTRTVNLSFMYVFVHLPTH